MIVQCDACQTKFRIDDSKVTEKGIKVKCTKCQNTFVVKPDAAVTSTLPEPPKESPFEVSLGPETKPEAQPAKEKEMTEDEKLAAEWAKSISFEEEKPAAQEEYQKSDIADIEASGAAMQMPSLGEEFSSLSFEEEEKKPSPTDIFAETKEEQPVFEPEIPPPPQREELIFEFPLEEKGAEPHLESHAIEHTMEVPAELPLPPSPLEHEEIHEKADETSTPAPQEIRYEYSKFIPILGIVVVIAGLALFYLSGGLTSISNMLGKKPTVSAGRLDIVEPKGYFMENTSIGKLFVIEGKITSTFNTSRDIIGIKGSIFSSKGENIGEKTASPGIIMSADDLKTASKDELEKRFKDQKKNSLPPKGSMLFMIVFSDFPTNPQEYGIELLQ